MIEINNLTSIEVDKAFLEKIVSEVLKGENIKNKVLLSIVLVGPARMRKLNKEYRNKNRITDVLAFPEIDVFFEKFKKIFKKEKSLGEIVICLREVKNNSKKFSLSFEKELANVLIHGLLHLIGYDHEKEKKEAEKMKQKQDFYLLKILKL